ncbi:MAG: hypothetical protein GXY38_01550 [Planctomycetes bacterium]|nr:hypothetical protein [Planctomycetota bacterium]
MARRRRWPRLVLATVVILAAALFAAREWLLPAYVRHLLVSQIGQRWKGSVHVDDVEVFLSGSVRVGSLGLKDQDGQQWVWAQAVSVRLRDWPSLSPRLGELDAEKLIIRARLDSEPPIASEGGGEDASSPAGDYDIFEALRIEMLRVVLLNDQQEFAIEDMSVTAARTDDSLSFHMGLLKPAQNQFDAVASLSNGGKIKFQLTFAHELDDSQADFISTLLYDAAAIDVFKAGAAGYVRGEGDIADPAGIDLRGQATVREGAICINKDFAVGGIAGRVALRHNVLTFADAAGETLGGRVDAGAELRWGGRNVEFSGSGRLTGIDLGRFGQAIDVALGEGTGDAEVRFSHLGQWRLAGNLAIGLQDDPPHQLGGLFDVEFADKAVISLVDWHWSQANRRNAELREALLAIDAKGLFVQHVGLQTPGGELSAAGELSWANGDGLTYGGTFSSKDFDLFALLPSGSEGGLSALRTSLEGEFSGSGAKHITLSAGGSLQAFWAGAGVDASADVSATLVATELDSGFSLDRLRVSAEAVDGLVRHRGAVVVDDLGIKSVLEDGSVTATLSAGFADGSVNANATGRAGDAGVAYSGEARFTDVDTAAISPALLTSPQWLRQALVTGHMQFEGKDFSSVCIKGGGDARMFVDAQPVDEVGGEFEFDGRVGRLKGTEAVEVHGTASIQNGYAASTDGQRLADNLRLRVISFGRSMDVSSIRGEVLGGKTLGMLRVDFPTYKAPSFRGGFTIENLDLPTMSLALGNKETAIRGKADMNYRFAGLFDMASLRGNGMLQIRDSRMLGVPVLDEMLSVLRVRPEATEKTDFDMVFSNKAGKITILNGRMATPVIALSIRPGGTANIQTHEIDAYVVAAVLDDIESLMNAPFLNLLVPFARGATQLHVTGSWDSRETIRVTKEPLRDMGEATLQFFRDVVQTGGEMGESFTRPVRQMSP